MPQPGAVFPCVFRGFFISLFLCRQNGKKKLPSFFGIDGNQERDTTTDKILQYIPAKARIPSTSNPSLLLQGLIPTLPKHRIWEGRWVWVWGLQQIPLRSRKG